MSTTKTVVALLLLQCSWHAALACTAYAAGKHATADGSVVVSHSDDGDGASDPRAAWVPAADHPKGSARPIWPDTEDWPRFVGTDRGTAYQPINGQAKTQPIGSIPQVEHTVGYIDGNYAVQNECHLMFGESTASAAFSATAVGTPGGTALMSVNELTRIAAERVCSAREAVQLMGSLSEKYGFYGADGGAGEVLMVGDTEEAFVFHILSDDTAKSSIWVAQRVPDNHVAVVANMFSIREVDLTDEVNFLGSANLHRIAREYGLWDGRGLLSFTDAYSGGEYSNKYYTGRRVWDGYRRFCPSLGLPAEYGNLKSDRPYPTTAKVDRPIGVRDWFAAYRSHYEGTPYDMTVGVGAGPFGSPDRYTEPGTSGDPGIGAWERSVSIFRTAATWVASANGAAPSFAGGTVWWAPADSSKSVFVPMMAVAADVPAPYTLGNPASLDRGSAFWGHKFVQNIAQLRYSAMIVDIQANARHWESRAIELVETIRSSKGVVSEVKGLLDAHAQSVLSATWQLSDNLMVKFADGALTIPTPDGSPLSTDLGYPQGWLDTAGFKSGPPRTGDLPGGETWGAHPHLEPASPVTDASVSAPLTAVSENVALAEEHEGAVAARSSTAAPPASSATLSIAGFFALSVGAALLVLRPASHAEAADARGKGALRPGRRVALAAVQEEEDHVESVYRPF
jgi:dipeptidase